MAFKLAFTLPELRDELEALGYGGIPDHVILSSLSKLLLEKRSWEEEQAGKTHSASRRGAHAGKASEQVHGSPVPGDREFVKPKKSKMVNKGGGVGSVCFTPDFATEIEEIRKMLRIMEGQEGEMMGPVRGRALSSQRKGLADEHDQYVNDLFGQWRKVGRSLSSKRMEKRALVGEKSQSSGESSGSGCQNSIQPEQQGDIRDTELPQSSGFLVASREPELPDVSDICIQQDSNDDDWLSRREESEEAKGENGHVDERLTRITEERGHEDDLATGSGADEEEEVTPGSEKGTDLEKPSGHKVLIRQDSARAGPPEISNQQGDVPHMKNGVDHSDNPEGHRAEFLSTQQESEEKPSASPPGSQLADPKTVLDMLAALSNVQFMAEFEKSLQELDPQGIIDQETFASVNQKITDTAANSLASFDFQPSRPGESENPLDLSVPVLRTPDRRGGGHLSPLNDRSNTHTEESGVLQKPRTKAVFRITEFNSALPQKTNSTSVAAQRSRSSRDPRRVEKGSNISEDRLDFVPATEFTSPPPSARKFKSVRASSSEKSSPRTALGTKTASGASHLDISSLGLSPIRVKAPASSPYNKASGGDRQQCGAAANGVFEHRQGTCSVCPPYAFRKSLESDSPHGSTSSVKSPYARSVGSGSSVSSDFDVSPRLKPPLRKDLEVSPKQKVPLRKDVEASPKQKLSQRKETEASPKQKLPIRKGTGPSGIYTPLVDHKNNDRINSSVLLKTSRLNSTMDFNSDGARGTYRRGAQSSTDSSQSSGTQRAVSSLDSKSNSESSPYSRSSTSNSYFGSRASTPKDKLTPGGPRRSGKVDRVARYAEMQNLWNNDKFLKGSSKRKPQSFHRIFARLHLSHERYTSAFRERALEDMRPASAASEAPPFVVPNLISNFERLKSR